MLEQAAHSLMDRRSRCRRSGVKRGEKLKEFRTWSLASDVFVVVVDGNGKIVGCYFLALLVASLGGWLG